MKNLNAMVIAAAVIALGGAFIGGQTLAYFTDSQKVTNTFTVGDLDIDEKEPEWDDKEDGKDSYPGMVTYKNPTVKNVTDVDGQEEPGYVRMRVSVVDEAGSPITDSAVTSLIWKTIYYDSSYSGSFDSTGAATSLVQGKADSKLTESYLQGTFPMVNPVFTLDSSRSKADGSEKVFNYVGNGGLLKAGEEATLFTTVVVPTDWNQTHLDKMGSYSLVITAEAIQAKGFDTQADAFTALDGEMTSRTSIERKVD